MVPPDLRHDPMLRRLQWCDDGGCAFLVIVGTGHQRSTVLYEQTQTDKLGEATATNGNART